MNRISTPRALPKTDRAAREAVRRHLADRGYGELGHSGLNVTIQDGKVRVSAKRSHFPTTEEVQDVIRALNSVSEVLAVETEVYEGHMFLTYLYARPGR